MKALLQNAALVSVSTVLTFVGLEAAYRGRVYLLEPQRFVQHDIWREPVPFFNAPFSTFNKRYGFDYPANREFVVTTIAGGQRLSCGTLRTNEAGTWSNRTPPPWQEAEIKVLVVGDSMTASAQEGRTWPDVFEELLRTRTGRSVSVRNLGRDGQGVLQMLDIAAGEIPETRPDLLILAYITDDLTRARIWRRAETVNGRLRLFTTVSGDDQFDLSKSVDTIGLLPTATKEWCETSPAPGRGTDPVVDEAEERHAAAVEHAGARISLFTLQRSLLIDRIAYGNPFHAFLTGGSRPTVNPRHTLRRFEDDQRTAENMRVIRASGIPIAVVHLATRAELRRGLEFDFADPEKEKSLLQSLERGLGVPTITTRDNAPPIGSIETIGVTPTDDHPSRSGMDFYARAMLSGMERVGIVDHL